MEEKDKYKIIGVLLALIKAQIDTNAIIADLAIHLKKQNEPELKKHLDGVYSNTDAALNELGTLLK